MRDIPTGLAGHLREGATTLCRCWTLRRRDGRVLGFTDHDRDLVLDGVVHLAGTGLSAAEATAELGFAVGGGDVSGALAADGISEADILAGLYDDAEVETWLVNWAAPDTRLRLDLASIGEIRRQDGAFAAELRGPLHRYDEEQGRLYRAGCAAELGDGRCRVDLAGVAFTGEGSVTATDGAARLSASGLAGFPSGWFSGGRLLWLGGADAGASVEVASHVRDGGEAVLELWRPAGRTIAPGDAFRVSAGCDKRLSTCRDRFGNVGNFRGFPHMPGNAFIAAVTRTGAPGLDGGSLFR